MGSYAGYTEAGGEKYFNTRAEAIAYGGTGSYDVASKEEKLNSLSMSDIQSQGASGQLSGEDYNSALATKLGGFTSDQAGNIKSTGSSVGNYQKIDPSNPLSIKAAPDSSAVSAVTPPPPKIPFAEALKNLNAQAGGAASRDAIGALAKTYQTPSATQQGFDAAKASGVGAPQVGSASGNTSAYIPPGAPNTSGIDSALAQDKGYQQLLKDQKEFNDTVNQHKSLTDTYDQLIKKAGIPGINTQLLNAKKIIDGTEDDIRKEVQAVSGFATDSQIMALSSARNKTLIQNYNNLLNTKAMAMENVNTMIGLAKEDQATALSNITQKMNLDEKLIDYRDKFINNAKEGYNNVLKAVGYAGLYQSLVNSGDPSAISLAERTLGLGAGQLQQLANYAPPPSEMDKLQLENQKLQNQKLRKDLSGGGTGSKLLSVSEAQDLGVPYGTTEAQAAKMGIVPGAVNGVDEKTMGKIQASPEYKTINGVLPAIQALAAYKEAINKYGGSEIFSGAGKGELAGTYGNAIAAWKTLAGLGALSGADFALAENAVPSTGFFQRNSTMKAKLNASIDNAIQQATNLTTRLTQNYPTAKSNLETQLDYAKVIAYPDKYKIGPDGQVYELTN